MIGETRTAKAFACSRTAITARAFPRPLRCAAPFGLPSFVPRAFAAFSAAFVRSEIASRSCSATSARMPMVKRFA